MGNGGMHAATANVNVHAMVYLIDFLNLKRLLLLKIRLVRNLLFGRSKRLVYAAKKFCKSMVLFCEILRSKKMVSLKKLCEKCMKVM